MTDDRAPVEIDDLYQLGWAEEPCVSPDGAVAAYVLVTPDRAANSYQRAIWLAPLDGSPPRRFTAGPRSDSQPRWSPDGRWLAFVSDRGGERPQIYLIARDGGEARCLTSAPNGAVDPAWSPDGKQIAFRSRVNAEERAREDAGEPPPPEDELGRRHASERCKEDERLRVDPRVVTRLPYRSGTSYDDGRHAQLYLIALPADDETPPPAARRLTDADSHVGPPAWTPDGASLIATLARDAQRDTLLGFDDVVRVPVPAEGRAPIERLTGPGFGYAGPLVSPDGRFVAAARHPEERPLFAGAHLALIPLDGGEVRPLTADADRDVEALRWLPDSSGVAYLAPWRGEASVYVARLDEGRKTDGQRASEAALTTGDVAAHESSVLGPSSFVPAAGRVINEFDVGPDGSVVFVAGSGESPCDLFVRRPDGTERVLVAVNRRLLAGRRVAPYEELIYPAPDGRLVQGWVVRPHGFDPAQSYPLAVHIHGGPHVMWAPGFRSLWHEVQANAASGYVVFFCNPRGSEGYGAAWRSAVDRDWGSADQDILAGVDAVIAQGGVDPARVAVAGGSYGGYMTAWLVGHSDRFACAVAARGVYNLLTEHGTSDAHELIEMEFGGFPWELHELLWQQSPIAHAHKIETPLLILHAELDYRVPIAEAEQLFSLLRRRGKVVELVRYPREGHELTRSGEPRHRADHMRRTFEWFDRYCRPGAS